MKSRKPISTATPTSTTGWADMTGVMIAVVLLSTLRFAARRLERPKQSERPLVPSPGTPGEG